MSAKLLQVQSAIDERRLDAIQTLEGLIEKARAGKITGVAVVYEGRDEWGSVASMFSDKRMMGAQLIELGMRGLLDL